MLRQQTQGGILQNGTSAYSQVRLDATDQYVIRGRLSNTDFSELEVAAVLAEMEDHVRAALQ